MPEITLRSKYLDQIRAGSLNAKWSVDRTRVLRYYIDLRHTALGLHRELSASDLYSLQSKADALMETWDKRHEEQLRKSQVNLGRTGAEAATQEAALRVGRLSTILSDALKRDARIDWEALKDRSRYPAKRFSEAPPRLKKSASPDYTPPTMTFLDSVLGRRRRIEAAAEAAHSEQVRLWANRERVVEDMHAADLKAWEGRKTAHEIAENDAQFEFARLQGEANARIDAIRQALPVGDPNAVVELALVALDRSDYADLFEKDYSVDYDGATKTLFVEYELPSPGKMPTVRAVKFSPATGEIVETHLSERDQKANYDTACYQIALRSLHELFVADEDGNIQQISFNGFASSVDRATGRDIHPCILSVVVKKDDFQAIDLSRVDPKACFKSLKGVSAASLAALAAVPPVMQMDRADKRFVDARDMSNVVDEGTNLASMSWEDFEHLVRQLFERVFSSTGGEVRITQASRDGGVDAVAFDPDPIRGGKIVIQAKRYTRVVGVSAVRDLYGTLMNEGASKGILVTTADYGPDAYSFASGKPIVLISGAQLLHMLGEHGFKARINIAEARKLLGTLGTETY